MALLLAGKCVPCDFQACASVFSVTYGGGKDKKNLEEVRTPGCALKKSGILQLSHHSDHL